MEVFFAEYLSVCFNLRLGFDSHLLNLQLANHVGGALARVALVTSDFFYRLVSCVPGLFIEVL